LNCLFQGVSGKADGQDGTIPKILSGCFFFCRNHLMNKESNLFNPIIQIILSLLLVEQQILKK